MRHSSSDSMPMFYHSVSCKQTYIRIKRTSGNSLANQSITFTSSLKLTDISMYQLIIDCNGGDTNIRENISFQALAGKCPSNWTNYKGSCYLYVTEKAEWENAQVRF